ncbi:hypothetical protein V6N13_013070 [Hibiscus sabdariffa]
MAAILPPLAHLGDDVPGWRWNEKRLFRLDSAYAVLMRARELWGRGICPEVANQFFTQLFEEWLHGNITGMLVASDRRVDWGMKFFIYCWLLWKLRCRMVLDVDHVDREDVWNGVFDSLLSEAATWFFALCRAELIADLWAVYDELRHTWESGFRRVELETDNREVASICDGSSSTLARSALVSPIHGLQR